MINWEKRQIVGKSGTIYKIEPENLSTGRYNEYILQGSMLAFMCDFNGLYSDWDKVERFCTTGNDVLKAITETAKIADRNKKTIASFTQNEPAKVIKFCSLVCIAPGEDVSIYDPVLTKQKFDDWAHIPINDFFLLQLELMNGLRKHLRNLQEEQKKKN